jgi:outer membrane protein OmpA-like peptidoglycan-associated protein
MDVHGREGLKYARTAEAGPRGSRPKEKNMQKRRTGLIACVCLTALALSTACVSKKVYRQDVEETDQRVAGVESAVEANERRISELGDETDQKIASVRDTAEQAVEIGSSAMTHAQAAQETAEKAAKGRLLWTVTLTDDAVRFSFDQASIPPEASEKIDSLVAKAKSLGRAVYFEIEGHTDNIGSEEYNHQLGEKRALAVRNYVSGRGIPLHALNTISYGESQPIADNATPEGRSQNRRVVIRVLE